MNEKGLVANLLWLVASEYPEFEKDGDQPGLTISAWAQYALDNFATVHLSLSDASGDSAIFEYIGGKLSIHHSRDYQVMTNYPPFNEQLAIKSYWDTVPG